MINLYVKNGNYNLAITLPSNYLREELHYADVSFSTPVSGTEDISVTLVPNAEHPIAQTVFDRLLPTDKITALNDLCVNRQVVQEAVNFLEIRKLTG